MRRVSTTEICLQFSECASKVTSFKEWLEYPDGGCDCLDSSEDKPSLGNGCAKLQSHPLGESCRCVQLWVSLCLREDIENFISTTESTLLPIFPLTFFLTFISLLSSLVHLFPHLSFSFVLKCCWGFFCSPHVQYIWAALPLSRTYMTRPFSLSPAL